MAAITPIGGCCRVSREEANVGREIVHGRWYVCPGCGKSVRLKPRVLAENVVEWPTPSCVSHAPPLWMHAEPLG